jgi:hypothetical protein
VVVVVARRPATHPADSVVIPAAAAAGQHAPTKDKRWTFRRPAQEGKAAQATPDEGRDLLAADMELDQKKHAVALR